MIPYSAPVVSEPAARESMAMITGTSDSLPHFLTFKLWNTFFQRELLQHAPTLPPCQWTDNSVSSHYHSAAEQSFLPIEQGRFCRFHPSDPTQPWPQSPACCINWYLVKYQTMFNILSNRDFSLKSLSCVACSLSPWSCRNASLSSTTLGTSWMPEKRSFLFLIFYNTFNGRKIILRPSCITWFMDSIMSSPS